MKFVFKTPFERRVRRVMRSGLFDAAWYQDQYGDQLGPKEEAIRHYVRTGEQQGLRPNRFFDPVFYREQAGAGQFDQMWLLHYRRDGWKAGLNPSAEFSVKGYLKANPDIDALGQEPLKHFMLYGIHDGLKAVSLADLEPWWAKQKQFQLDEVFEGFVAQMSEDDLALWHTLRLSGLFDAKWYRETYMSADSEPYNALLYYIWNGIKADHNPNAFFDSSWYRGAYGPSLGSRAPIQDYMVHSKTGGRDPSDNFSTSIYLGLHPNIAEGDIDPLAHFILNRDPSALEPIHFGHVDESLLITTKEDRALWSKVNDSGLFDADWYNKRYQEAGDLCPPLTHYVKRGIAADHPPNELFDPVWYRAKYGDQIREASPILDFLSAGPGEERDPSAEFSCKLYAKSHPQVAASGINPLGHYITFGRHQGQLKPLGPDDALTRRPREDSKLPVAAPLRGILDWAQTELAPVRTFDREHMHIHWVIPDFEAGGGGHMTIFRMIQRLEIKGHIQTVWINNPIKHETPEDAYDNIQRHFQHFAGTVNFITEDFPNVASGDALIATDFATVYPVMAANKFTRRFYFVQDFEPGFAPMGAHQLVAEQTYRFDLDCLCASPWLKTMMEEKYGRYAMSFMLAADAKLYHPPQNDPRPRPHGPLRIAVYARHFTARRAVELAYMALEDLAARKVPFEVDFFGAKLDFTSAPFPYRDHGVATPEELGDLFRSCDIGVVFSATNYSLVPQEMMASGLPIVELDGESTRAIFPEDVVAFAKPHPRAIADQIETLIQSPELRGKQAAKAMDWVKGFSWDGAAELIEDTLQERTSAYASKTLDAGERPITTRSIKASVVIPTWNAGPKFRQVLDAVRHQTAPWQFEILVIDSGSTDGTVDLVRACSDVRLQEIPQSSFDHGDTRNLGVELTSGDFIAFLTHDALPYNDRWLFSLVSAMEHHGPKAAGGIGKHLAWPDASPFTKRDLNAHFEMLADHPLAVTKDTDQKAYSDPENPQWRQFLHFYSDNNSCMRRDVWEQMPYPKTMFGEDQIWANMIIEAGYTKVYAPRAIVYHSHDYDAAETYERQKTESAFFKHFFGYKLLENQDALEKALKGINKHDTKWGFEQGLTKSMIEERLELNEARLKGMLDGALANTKGLFD